VKGLMSVKESTNLKYWKKRATNQGLGTHFVYFSTVSSVEEVKGLMSVKESTNLKHWKKRATNQGLGTLFITVVSTL
jgi:hypothetical protein